MPEGLNSAPGVAQHRTWLQRLLSIRTRAELWGLSTLGVMASVLAVVFYGGLLVAAFCAFTNFRFTLIDYGRYTNMIWNCGHGRPFRMLADQSYLSVHLSFSLALLGPLFRVWDHPFLLAVIQWIGLGLGAGFLMTAAARAGAPWPVRVAMALAYASHPYTQSVILSEFHGVGLYLLLVPWTAYALSHRRPLVWLPWILILGVREDAAFLLLPMGLYAAVKDRWRTGYGLALLALLYGIAACTVLFSWINEGSLLATRPSIRPANIGTSWLQVSAADRLVPLLWLILPAVPFAITGWPPVLLYPLVATAVTAFSPHQPNLGSRSITRRHPWRSCSPPCRKRCVWKRSAHGFARTRRGSI